MKTRRSSLNIENARECRKLQYGRLAMRMCTGFFLVGDVSHNAMAERIEYMPVTTNEPKRANSPTFRKVTSSKFLHVGTSQTTENPNISNSKDPGVDSSLSYLNHSKSLEPPIESTQKLTEMKTYEISEATTIQNMIQSTQAISQTNNIKTNSTQETNDINVLFPAIENNVPTTSSSSRDVTTDKLVKNNSQAITTTVSGETEFTTIEGTEKSNVPESQTSKELPQHQTSSSENTVDSVSEIGRRILKDVCNSTNCDLTAARIISSMDYSKQPCENFYEFACGGILGSKPKKLDIFSPELLYGEGVPEFITKFNTFYHSCLKHEDRFNYQTRIKKAKHLLSTIGSFHFDGETNKTYNITKFIANLILFKAMPLFEVDIDIDPDDSTYILKVMMPDQTSLDFEHWSSLSESKRKCLRETNENSVGSSLNMTLLYRYYRSCQMNYSDFLDSIDIAVTELGIFSQLTEKEIFKHIRDIRVFIEFEIFSLFEEIASPPHQQEVVVRRKSEKIRLAQLEEQFPLIEWEKLFRMISNKNVTNETQIQMFNRRYFEDVFRGLSQLNKGMLNNAFLAILANSLFENTVLPSHKHSRTNYCKERTEELMPDIVNFLYKKIIPTQELNERNLYTEEIYETLAEKLNASLENLEWLDDPSRESVRKKLNKIQLTMFRNDDVETESAYLLVGYEHLELKDSDYQFNLFNLIEFNRKRLFSLQGQRVSSENMYRYFVDASKEEPVFFYANDIVCIPYGLTRRANNDLPRYIVMAQIGFPLAKILGHAFDSIGMQYRVQLSETANLSYLNFADQTRDMIVLSNPIKFGSQEVYFSLNNALSEGERIAENTALRLLTDSFDTFTNDSLLPWISYKFKKEKIFFLALTQEFCRNMGFTEFLIEAYESHILPPQFRIENILGNSEEFLKQFSCRPGSAMTRFEDRLQFPYLTALSKEDLDYMN